MDSPSFALNSGSLGLVATNRSKDLSDSNVAGAVNVKAPESNEGLRRRRSNSRSSIPVDVKGKSGPKNSGRTSTRDSSNSESTIRNLLSGLEHPVNQDQTVDMIMKEEQEALLRKRMEEEASCRDNNLESGSSQATECSVRPKGQVVILTGGDTPIKLNGFDQEQVSSGSNENKGNSSRNKPSSQDNCDDIYKPLLKRQPAQGRILSSDLSSTTSSFQNTPIIVPLSQVSLSRHVDTIHWSPLANFFPRKLLLDKCAKCDRAFLSSLNLKRHVRTHNKKLPADRNLEEMRSDLSHYISSLSPAELAEVVSIQNLSVEGVSGEEAMNNLALLLVHIQSEFQIATIQQSEYNCSYKDRLEAGKHLLSISQQSSDGHVSVKASELFHWLSLGSESTFLVGDVSVPALQRQLFQGQGEGKKAGLEHNNVVACVVILLELSLVTAWLKHKEQEALVKQMALVEEEEAAQRKLARVSEKKREQRMRKQRNKEIKRAHLGRKEPAPAADEASQLWNSEWSEGGLTDTAQEQKDLSANGPAAAAAASVEEEEEEVLQAGVVLGDSEALNSSELSVQGSVVPAEAAGNALVSGSEGAESAVAGEQPCFVNGSEEGSNGEEEEEECASSLSDRQDAGKEASCARDSAEGGDSGIILVGSLMVPLGTAERKSEGPGPLPREEARENNSSKDTQQLNSVVKSLADCRAVLAKRWEEAAPSAVPISSLLSLSEAREDGRGRRESAVANGRVPRENGHSADARCAVPGRQEGRLLGPIKNSVAVNGKKSAAGEKRGHSPGVPAARQGFPSAADRGRDGRKSSRAVWPQK